MPSYGGDESFDKSVRPFYSVASALHNTAAAAAASDVMEMEKTFFVESIKREGKESIRTFVLGSLTRSNVLVLHSHFKGKRLE